MTFMDSDGDGHLLDRTCDADQMIVLDDLEESCGTYSTGDSDTDGIDDYDEWFPLILS